VIDVVQVQPAHQRVLGIEPAFQRQRQVRDVGAYLAFGQFGQHGTAAFAVDERFDSRRARTWWRCWGRPSRS
jgi:hypothetical protein